MANDVSEYQLDVLLTHAAAMSSQQLFRRLRDFTVATRNPVLSSRSDTNGSMLLYPVDDMFEQDGTPTVVAHIVATIPWGEYFGDVSSYLVQTSCSR